MRANPAFPETASNLSGAEVFDEQFPANPGQLEAVRGNSVVAVTVAADDLGESARTGRLKTAKLHDPCIVSLVIACLIEGRAIAQMLMRVISHRAARRAAWRGALALAFGMSDSSGTRGSRLLSWPSVSARHH